MLLEVDINCVNYAAELLDDLRIPAEHTDVIKANTIMYSDMYNMQSVVYMLI